MMRTSGIESNVMNQRGNADSLLRVTGLRKRFGERVVLEEVSLDVLRGNLFTVMGPSGAGKSVFLKCLADVIQPDGGKIEFEGKTLDFRDPSNRRQFHRRCSFLFQSNALFDSLTAMENVALPLEQTTSFRDSEIRKRALDALAQLELHDHARQFPGMLSGGMQKRLALARAIVTQPELVFFDEPTAGLDPLRRNAVFAMIAKYQRQFGFTALIVTHDVVEALAASDRVALLAHGKLCFTGTPEEFDASGNEMVRAFRDSPQALRATLAAIRRGETFSADDGEDL
jgi:phospholipid/cholesterol/gamma-HCH transport system ATP-binding protein